MQLKVPQSTKIHWFAAFAVAASVLMPDLARAATVKPISPAQLKKAIRAQRGKVVLVNFWATWCPPCVEEFPALARLQKQYAKKGVAVIFVSADEPKSARKTVAPFLSRNRVATSWIISGDQMKFIKDFDPKLKGSVGIPLTYIYNRRGQLKQTFSGGKTYAQFEKIVKTTR